VIAEIAGLVENGYQEIVLTGICLGDYGKEMNYSLPRLLEEIQNLDFNFRIRLSSIEPQDVNKELVSAIKNFKKVVPHLHIPLQSGSDKILALMKRKYDVSYFKKLILYLKQEVDNFQFSTDVMVGFPQETEADFVQTVEILNLLKPIKVHIFPFSPRPNTSAYQLEGRLPPKVVWERKKRLQELVERMRKEALLSQIGKKLEVLFERKKNGYWLGYSENYILSALLEEGNLENKLIPVVAIGVMDSNLLLTQINF
jgi:threonylcarbamoyladenosine tRNA methylthiotransferase MtaB